MSPNPYLVSGTRLCAVDEVDDGVARVVELRAAMPIVEVIVIRRGGDWIGYHNFCPHNFVPLNMLSTLFVVKDSLVCDHHSALFRIEDGYCTTGPCKGDSLTKVPLAIRDGAVFIA